MTFLRDSVIDWLLDSDPAIRWQAMRDLTGDPAQTVAIERSRVAREGWGARLLELQGPDGRWDGGTYRPGWVDESKPFFDAWTATHFSLQQLRDFGVDPADPRSVAAIALVRENVRWEANDALYFEGETEPCINGIALAVGSYFGQSVEPMVERLLADRLPDGGWNCFPKPEAPVSSFHTTICALEGLLEWHRQTDSSDPSVTEALAGGEEYLLERRLFRTRTAGTVVDPRYTMFSYPTRWYYDVLRGLDHLRAARRAVDDRCAEALDLVVSKRDQSGRWRLENKHKGPTHFDLEGSEGSPSRWNTLRAMRVLDWAGVG